MTQLGLFTSTKVLPKILWDDRTTWKLWTGGCKYCGERIVWMQESRGWVPYDYRTLAQHWGVCFRNLEE